MSALCATNSLISGSLSPIVQRQSSRTPAAGSPRIHLSCAEVPQHAGALAAHGIGLKAESRRRHVAARAAAANLGGLEGTRLPSQFLELASQEELDQVLEEAKQNKQAVLVEWMAQWCRKCIYLKPKIEKIVHEYPRVRCCVVDVNKVPYAFVKSANISKMPTLQLWIDGEQVEELVGGEAAWQVLDKVRAMITKHV